ncbi:MAG: hypothetical protein ABIJ09_06005 [Pseudomonadota bacterium]
MFENDTLRPVRTLTLSEAFSDDELKWFSEFDRDTELWNAVDSLFPDKTPRMY